MKRILCLLLLSLFAASAQASVIKTVQAGATDVTVVIKIIDSADGTPEVGVAFNTSGIDIEYWRHGANSVVDITEATQTVSGAHSDGGIVHLGNGYYRLDLPDAAVASSASAVEVMGTVTGMIVIGGTVQLDTNIPQTGDSYARIGAPAGASIAADIVVLDNFVDDLESRLGTPSNLGGGATVAGNLSDIEGQTDDIGALGAGLTAVDDAVMTRLGAAVGASISADIASVKSDSTAILDDTGTSGVLISTGTGTGQVSMSSGIVNSNVAQVSADATAADSLELALDLQGGANGAIPWAGIHASGTAQAYTAGTPSITLASATAYGDDDLNCTSIAVRGSTQDDWVTGTISDYVGSTDIATLSAAFANAPSGTLTYIVWGTACASGAGGSLTAADVWAYSTRSLTILDEDSTTIDLNASYVGGVTTFDEDTTTIDINATTLGTVTTLTGHTAQTGDAYARLGAPAGASIAADIVVLDNFVDDLESRMGTPSNLGGGATLAANNADIEAQTDDIGTAGAGLTALATQASVNTVDDFVDDVETRLTATRAGYLDNLSAGAVATASALSTTNGNVNDIETIANKLDSAMELDSAVYRFTINALEQAPAGGGGGSTDWTSDERTAMRAILGIPASGTTPEDVSAGILDTIRDSVATRASQSSVDVIDGTVDAILVDTGTTLDDLVDDLESRLGTPSNLGGGATLAANAADIEGQTDDIGTAGIGLTGLPWNASWDTEVQSEATDALNAYDPPTAAELTSGLASADDAVLAAIAALNDLAAADLRDLIIEPNGNITLGCVLAAIHAYTSGELTTASNVSTYEDHSGTSTRQVMTISSSGNRTVTVTCPSY